MNGFVDMTAHSRGLDYYYKFRWFVKLYPDNQWREYTSDADGPQKESLTIEQVFGYCIDVYCIADYYEFKKFPDLIIDSSASSVYGVCYGDEP